MKQYRKWFVFMVTFVIVMCVFLICDTILGGILFLLCRFIWGEFVAQEVFKWVVSLMFASQTLFTFPFALKAVDKE